VLADACQRRQLAEELAGAAASGELDAILAETGLARGQLQRLLQGHAESPRLLEAMTQRLGIEREAIAEREILREIERICSLCDSRGPCRRWLRSGATDGYDAFCPNAEWFDHLRQPAATMPVDASATEQAQQQALSQEPYV
jgi:hypothetical protein